MPLRRRLRRGNRLSVTPASCGFVTMLVRGLKTCDRKVSEGLTF